MLGTLLKGKVMTDTDKEPKATKTYDKRKVIIGMVCLILIGIGIFYIWHKDTKKAQQEIDVTSAIAIVDVDKLLSEHPNYDRFMKLQAEELVILNQLKNIMDDKDEQTPVVEPAPEVFSNVIDEQDNLRNINLQQQLKEQSAAKENEIRNNLAEDKNKIIQEINDKFFNAILNATIKLDNADTLRLTQEERTNLLSELEQLKKQRGEAVFQIEQQYNQRVAKELMQWRIQREKELGLVDLEAHQADVADSQAKQAVEQQRENAYLQDRLKMLQARKNDSERLVILLQAKSNEMSLLKKSMLKDIASKATKVAIQKHLKLVIANTPMNLNFLNDDIDVVEDELFSGMVVGVDALDITDDVLKEIQEDKVEAEKRRQQMQNNQDNQNN